MVDVHCHILPGLDDGPDTMEESLAMAETAIAEGITHVVAITNFGLISPMSANSESNCWRNSATG